MKKSFKNLTIASIITSILFIIIGIIMLVKPDIVIKTIAIFIGTIIIIIGLQKIISYFILKQNYSLYNYELLYGIIALIIGIVLISNYNTFATIARVIFGIWIVYTSIMKMTVSLKLKEAQIQSWKVICLVAVLTLVAGIFIIFDQNIIMTVTGIVIILYAISDIIDRIIFMKNIDKLI